MTDLLSAIRKRIGAAGSVLVVSHIRPDGDAVGSALALGLGLIELGKNVQMVLADGVPDSCKHLAGSERIRTQAEGDFDLIVTVDCSDLKRVGAALDGYRAPDIVIDHHATTEPFGTLNLIEPEAAATASILIRCLPRWGMPISLPMAAALMTGLLTDTLGFRTPNVTPGLLRQAADLLEMGVDMSSLYTLSLVQRTLPQARYWGAGLSDLQQADGIVWTALSLADRAAAGYAGSDDADLINIVSSIYGADVAIMFVEQAGDRTKVSWRGLRPNIDVSSIARQFDGGGHKAAAGAELDGSLAEVQERVLSATRSLLDRH
jgi:phosphoesterase RecJ-like protein